VCSQSLSGGSAVECRDTKEENLLSVKGKLLQNAFILIFVFSFALTEGILFIDTFRSLSLDISCEFVCRLLDLRIIVFALVVNISKRIVIEQIGTTRFQN
jgi:hypothetical protein